MPAIFRVTLVIIFITLQHVSAQDIVRLKLKYPRPMYVGTPKDLDVEKLERTWEITKPPFLVPEGTVNLALDKLVECSDEEPVMGDPDLVTDGEKDASDGFYIELDEGQRHITIVFLTGSIGRVAISINPV